MPPVVLTLPETGTEIRGAQWGPARPPRRSHGLSWASDPGRRLGPGGRAPQLLLSLLSTSVPGLPLPSIPHTFRAASQLRPATSANRLTLAVQRSFWKPLGLGIQGSPCSRTRRTPAVPGVWPLRQESLPSAPKLSSFVLRALEPRWQRGATGIGVSTVPPRRHHESHGETVARDTGRLPIRAHFPLHG